MAEANDRSHLTQAQLAEASVRASRDATPSRSAKAIKAAKHQLQPKVCRPLSYIATRLVVRAEAILAAHRAELIAEATADRRTLAAEGFFGKRAKL